MQNRDDSICEEVDMVIGTDLFTYYEVEKVLERKGYRQIISLEEILYGKLRYRDEISR